MKYGYARTSSRDRTAALQLAALKRAGCARIYHDKGLAGGVYAKRPALTRCLATLRSGDTLVVWKLDRPGYALRGLIAVLDDLRARGVNFRSLTEALDTTTPVGRAMWRTVGMLADLERSLISERTRAGVKAAQRRGVKFGRRPVLNARQIDYARKLIDKGEGRQHVADLLKVGRSTLYRALNKQ
jgi:DNA invertase Pin-like site-specific DNA recombinase